MIQSPLSAFAGWLAGRRTPSPVAPATSQSLYAHRATGENALPYNSLRTLGAKSCRKRIGYSSPYSPPIQKRHGNQKACEFTNPGSADAQPGAHLRTRHQLVTSYEATAYASNRHPTLTKSVALSLKDAIGAKMSNKRGSCVLN